MTIAAEVKNIRRYLQDEPITDVLSAAVVAAGTLSMTVTNVNLFAVGQWWEFDDDTGDKVLVTAVNASTSVCTIRRGYRGSTATSHLNGAVLSKSPRFEYDTVSQAINTVLDIDLYGEGIFDLQEHTITSSTTTTYYDAPAAGCLEFKDVYQWTSLMKTPGREILVFSDFPRNVDTAAFSSAFTTGKYFQISGNYGVPGTDVYYVTCAHKHAIGTLTAGAQRIVDYWAAAYVLEWEEIKRAGGPTNQGDQTVRPGARIPTAAYFHQQVEEWVQKERKTLEALYPAATRFVRNGNWIQIGRTSWR